MREASDTLPGTVRRRRPVSSPFASMSSLASAILIAKPFSTRTSVRRREVLAMVAERRRAPKIVFFHERDVAKALHHILLDSLSHGRDAHLARSGLAFRDLVERVHLHTSSFGGK